MRVRKPGARQEEDAAASPRRPKEREGKDGMGEQSGKGGEDEQKERGGGSGQGNSKEELEWFVLARLHGSLFDAPMDGVERRFTSFFSKLALQLDPQAFPEVAAVEVSD